jgi:predicted ATPase
MDTTISEFHIEGYRSLKDVTWRPGALNVVIGPNASGKSNILKALGLISASARGRLQDFIDEDGGIASVVNWTSARRTIAFRVAGEPAGGEAVANRTIYDVSISRLGQTPSYRIDREELSVLFGGRNSRGSVGTIGPGPETTLSEQVFRPNEELEDTIADAETSALYPGFDLYRSLEARNLKATLSSYLIIDDLQFGRESKARSAVTARFADRLDADGANLSSVMHTLYTSGDDFAEQVNDAMFAAFGIEFVEIVFPPTGGVSNIQLAIKWKSIKTPVATNDLSDGTLRFLAIIGALTHPNPPALIAIDEPELGLHPSLMRIIANHAAHAASRSQVVFTTHSSQFLDAIGEFNPTVSVTSLEHGATVLKTIAGDELDYWLKRYTLGDLQDSGQLESVGAAIANPDVDKAQSAVTAE